jgi:MFS family permease
MATYHAVVLPSVFVMGPVVMVHELDGARSWAIVSALFGVGNVLGDLVMLRWRPRHAMRVASVLLVGASCQAAIFGSGLGAWGIGLLELLAGACVTGVFTLWETSLGEHVPERSLSRVSSYDYLTSTGMIPLGNAVCGAVGGAVGIHPTLLGMSAVGVVVSLLVAAQPSVRSLPRGAALGV